MKIGISVNLTRYHAHDVTKNVLKKLIDLKVTVLMSYEFKSVFDDFDIEFKPDEEWVSESDMIIAIGGDGTIIHTSHLSAKYDVPILGINAGNLGFLAGLEKTELDLLEKLYNGEYYVDNRMMLCCELYEDNVLIDKYYSLNDTVIARGSSMTMCDIELSANDELSMNYTADGLIFSTPTGSTAYNLSAGGPVLDPIIESIIATPICPHSIFNRSIIFSADTKIDVRVNNLESCDAVFSPDGEESIRLNNKNRLIIRRGNRYVKIIRLKPDNFVRILKNKLTERRI